MPRIILSISDVKLAGLDWEQALRTAVSANTGQPLIVRTAATWPRSAAQSLTLPLRILELSNSGAHRVVDRVVGMLKHFPATVRSDAVLAESCLNQTLGDTWQYAKWPTIDVLHFDEFPSSPDALRRLSIAAINVVGTLGWLCRVADVNQTRLIVLCALNTDEARDLRSLAAAVVNRGGPAVVIVSAPLPQATAFVLMFYDRLIHDSPIDAAFKDACAKGPGNHALFGGSGREDLLRVSNIGVGLLDLHSVLVHAQTDADVSTGELVLSRGGGKAGLSLGTTSTGRAGNMRVALDKFESEWHGDGFRFENHEREGLVPMAERIRDIRVAAGVEPTAHLRVPAASPVVERFLNSSLCKEVSGAMRRIEQRGARLQVGGKYHLEVQIGGKDVTIQTIGDAALIEEDFKWTPAMRGKWVAIGVTGIDFDVLGDPVQEFWLPREGDSEPIRFAISPRVGGAARLRFCLYQGNEVLRSYRLAAVVLESSHNVVEPGEARDLLAKTLDVVSDKVEDFGYMARLEYSIAPSVIDPPNRPQPAVSLVANDLNGITVVTMKDAEGFAVRVSGSLKEQVSDARRVLHLVEAPSIVGLEPKDWPYGFTPDNVGTEVKLKKSLKLMAEVGWRLFDSVIPGNDDDKQRLKDLLATEPKVIQVAHVLLEKVIPWALVYDREYDPAGSIDRDGNPVEPEVCLAALNQGATKMACGQSAQCVLHETNLQRHRLAAQTELKFQSVVCPLHFWGLRHVIEIPPHQVKQGDGRSLKEKVIAGPQAELLRAMNRSLTSAVKHASDLDTLADIATKEKAPTHWKTTLYDRNAIKTAMDDEQLDVLYFYCHARGGEDDPENKTPQLYFGKSPNALAPEHMGSKAWPHQPLVILNGCSTVGYSPDALSPFIEKLVQDRGAAGVLGTEIPVWEPLATEFAHLFLTEFLNSQPAGQALLSARRALLAKYNPLGLVYTLYASAGLRLERANS